MTTDRIPLASSVHYAVRGLPEVPNQYGPGVLVPSEITLTYQASSDSQLGRVHAYVAGRIFVDGVETPLQPGGLYGQHYFDGLDGWPAWLAEEARLHDPESATDRAALRDRIAEALYALMLRNGWDGERTEPVVREMDLVLEAVLAELPAPVDRAAVLREAAQHLYTALFPAVYDDMGQKAAEGVNRAASELRRMADEAQPAEVPARDCPDDCPCRRVCIGRDHQPAAEAQQDGADVRLRCPQCGEDITNYAEDDFVYRTGDDRPYCSGECVVAAHRAAGAQQDGARP
ncbi:hypothetical protein ACH4C6_21770 [Streptomyces sp. NPDC017943]|uniref:hypothetical protein n=1 Tax=Streptomyces sp. NPDC017943 TaxID=3365019 RepID=UPI00379F7280